MSSLALYRGLTTVAEPLVRFYLGLRAQRGKEDPARMAERRGIASAPRPEGPLIWLHAASVGEAQSALALIGRLLAMRADVNLLVTSGTVTSAGMLDKRLPERAIHQYVPADLRRWVGRFLSHWRPDMALFVESELWPNLVLETAARGCPLVLVNGRLSARSFKRWRKIPGIASPLMRSFALCLGQTDRDREHFAALGAPRCEYLGNLKYSAEPLPVDEAALEAVREAVGGRPFWLAASTHPGEEELAAAVHMALKDSHPGLLTIIVPRHPNRGDEIEAMLDGRFVVRRRSKEEPPNADCEVYLADTLGELGLFYRLAEIAFIGGSTGSLGGHNPLEAAQLDCAVIHGPDMSNFRVVAADLAAAEAALSFENEAGLIKAVARLLEGHDERKRLARAARKVSIENADALDRIAGALAPFVEALPGSG
ncbi:MAG: 3-deoxy-D-manno-octulosonic acid transferase [Alphaproteobacteria bacterium]|nr:3-deoxy-D-manno-octulosonic acid transferase [Alphaproteobacteria bacterium]